jgi:peptidoglycan/LPS O-acetylase OafA/YrhL
LVQWPVIDKQKTTMNEPQGKESHWYAALDGYRGLAVLAVVFFHSEVIAGGWLGVDLFFVLSGFLIMRVVLREKNTTGNVSLKNFWYRRLKRLMPALILFLVGVAAFVAWYPEKSLLPSNLAGEFVATVAYVANWFTIFSTAGYWAQYSVPSPLQHMWSLAIEEQFYIVFPLVVAALLFFKKRHLIGTVFAALTLTSWGLALWYLSSGANFERVYLGTETRMGAITLGALVGYLTMNENHVVWLKKVTRFLVVPAAVIAAFLLFSLDGNVEWSPQRWLLVILFELAVVCLLVVAVHPPKRGLSKKLNTAISVRFLVWFGGISYGLYLWHIPVQLTIKQLYPSISNYLLLAGTLSASTGIAYLSLRFVEKPIRQNGLSVFKNWHLPERSAFVGAAALVVFSFIVVQNGTEPAKQVASQRNVEPVQQVLIAAPSESENQENREKLIDFESNPRVTLVGDSMIYDMQNWFIEYQEQLGVVASATSLIGCGAGGMTTDKPDTFVTPEFTKLCQDWLDKLPQVVNESNPDIIVILRVSHRPPTEQEQDQCNVAYREWYRAAVIEEIKSLQTSGAPIFIVTSVYNRFPGSVEEKENRIADCLNTEKRVAAQQTGEQIIELNDWLCPNRECMETFDGQTLREDGLHFSGTGNVIALEWMLDQIRKTPLT